MISIKKFKPEDKKTLIALMEELQNYLVQIDPMKRLRRLPGYGGKYVKNLLKKIEKKKRIIFIAYSKNIPIGLIAGVIETQYEEKLLSCVPSKAGNILELIVSKKYRGQKVGLELMRTIEKYFQSKKCTVFLLEVFEPNNHAHNFYKKLGYQDRTIGMIKEVK